jgi:hypothetical protein
MVLLELRTGIDFLKRNSITKDLAMKMYTIESPSNFFSASRGSGWAYSNHRS